MKRVICTGLAVLDHVFYLPEIPKNPIKSFATNYQNVGGGNAPTAAVAISRAGGQAIFWGSLGDDLNGDIILSELEEFGGDVPDVFRFKGLKSGVSSVLIEEPVNIAGEIYISILANPETETHMVMLRKFGGVDIEELAEKSPEKIKNDLSITKELAEKLIKIK